VLKRIFTSRWCKWASRLFASFLLLLAVTIAVMSVASVESSGQRQSSTHSAIVKDDDWPARESPAAPNITRTGPGPIDLGAYKCCRVLSLSTDDEHGVESFMLVTTTAPAANAGQQGNAVLNGTTSVGGEPSDYRLTLENQNLAFAQVMPATKRAIGTLLYLGSIDVNSAGETKMLQLARDRGWNVLACSIGMDYMMPERIVVDDHGSTRLARRIDNHLADRAYAMEALIAYLQSHRPDMLVGPRVIVGMSAGAIALPTVVARIGPVDAAVVIGGGENVAEIIADSPLFSQHIELVDVRLEASPQGDRNVKLLPCENPKKRAEFVAAVLRKSKIDPRHAAAALKDAPVLMVQAKYDDIVPAAAGQSMYESLDRPERWHYRTGHIGLTLLMPWKIDYVLDWMATQTAREAAR
jgi:hypothetical protein